jgi:hypothetical protein
VGTSGSPGSPGNLLTPADFTYLGSYDIQTNGPATNLAQGLTGRRVNGDFRILSFCDGRLDEISLAGKAFGSLITTPTRSWTGLGGLIDFKGFWWDEAKQRLWSNTLEPYDVNYVPTQIYTRTLNDNGTVSNLHGPVSLDGIPAKRVFGGAQAVPAWFQTQYGVGPYMVGWGGGTSTVLQGGSASLGFTAYTMPDPALYSNGATVPIGQFRTIAEYTPGAGAGARRGVRVTIPINYMDGGDNRPNGTFNTAPDFPPIAGAEWVSPRADGKGWMTIPDSYWNTGSWIDGPNKQGFVAILSAWSGKVWYMNSDYWCEKMKFELHIFDPSRFGEVLTGARAPHTVEPTHMIELNLPGLSNQGPRAQMTPGMSAGGATYDPVSKRLYILGLGVNGFSSVNRLYTYQVNA